MIYSESHDEVANGKCRVFSEIDPHDQYTSSIRIFHQNLPSPGAWRLRLNSDWDGYFPTAGTIAIGPYSALVFSQDRH